MEILHLREVTSENMSVIPSSHSTVTYLFTLNEKQDFVLTVFFIFVEDYFPEVCGESHSHRKLRNANYNECWNSIKKEIEVRVDFPFFFKCNRTSHQLNPRRTVFLVPHVMSLIFTVVGD